MKNTCTPFCSVIIPALNEQKDIESCLASLASQTYPRSLYEIIVIDNGSTDRTVEIARKYADIVVEKLNCHVGVVRNYGADLAKGTVLISTDADCIVDSDWIETGVHLLLDNPNTLFGGGLKPRKDSSWLERLWLLNDEGLIIQQKDLMGSCIFTFKTNYIKAGKFPETVSSGEDSALSQASRDCGLSVRMEAKLSVAHFGSPATLLDFLLRQIWHSENYSKNLKESIKDRTFIISLLFLISTLTLFFSILTINKELLTISILGFLIFPLILSIKRLRRSRYKPKSLVELLKIYIIDQTYLIGRSLGIILGAIKSVRPLQKGAH